MITIRTTEYYKPHFGSIIQHFRMVGYSEDKAVYEYVFQDKTFLHEWLNESGLKIKRGSVLKGKTTIGAYLWNKM